MIPKPKNNILIDRGSGSIAKLAWFHESKNCELIFGIYGLTGSEPLFAMEYENRPATKQEMLNLKIPHREAKAKDRLPADHFTLHNKKGNKLPEFHLRYGPKPVHQIKLSKGSISPDSPVIFDFFILSDVTSLYKNCDEQPDNTDCFFVANPDSMLSIRGRVTGINCDIEQIIREEEINPARTFVDAVILDYTTLKISFTSEMISLDEEAKRAKNRGTYFIVRFQTEADQFLIKTFIFL